MAAVENRGGEAVTALAGELATMPTLADIAGGRVDALRHLGGLQHVLRARAARGGGEERQVAAQAR